jgi:hypothetical protein
LRIPHKHTHRTHPLLPHPAVGVPANSVFHADWDLPIVFTKFSVINYVLLKFIIYDWLLAGTPTAAGELNRNRSKI